MYASPNRVKTYFDYLRSRYVNGCFHEANVFTRKTVIRETRSRRTLSERGALSCNVPVRCAPFYLVFSFGRSPCLARRDRANGTRLARKLKRAFVFLRVTHVRRSPSTVGQPRTRGRKEGKDKEEGEGKREEEVDFASELRSRKTREIVGRIAWSDDRVTRRLRPNNDDGVPGKTPISESFAELATTRRHRRLDRDHVHDVAIRTKATRRNTVSEGGGRTHARVPRCGVLTRSAKRPALDE